jgi:hypothetical protein
VHFRIESAQIAAEPIGDNELVACHVSESSAAFPLSPLNRGGDHRA